MNLIKIEDLVLATTEAYGSYICRIENLDNHGRIQASVQAVVEYPGQHAILYKDNIASRKPYPKNYIRFFDHIEHYTGEVPEYDRSVKESLETAITQAELRRDAAELLVLKRHKNEFISQVTA